MVLQGSHVLVSSTVQKPALLPLPQCASRWMQACHDKRSKAQASLPSGGADMGMEHSVNSGACQQWSEHQPRGSVGLTWSHLSTSACCIQLVPRPPINSIGNCAWHGDKHKGARAQRPMLSVGIKQQ